MKWRNGIVTAIDTVNEKNIIQFQLEDGGFNSKNTQVNPCLFNLGDRIAVLISRNGQEIIGLRSIAITCLFCKFNPNRIFEGGSGACEAYI